MRTWARHFEKASASLSIASRCNVRGCIKCRWYGVHVAAAHILSVGFDARISNFDKAFWSLTYLLSRIPINNFLHTSFPIRPGKYFLCAARPGWYDVVKKYERQDT